MRERPLDLRRLHRAELVGFAGAGILLLSLFLSWFSTSCDSHLMPHGCNANSEINHMRGSFNAFQTFTSLQWLLLAACVAPFILAYIIARGHELTWRPGEITMIVGMVSTTLVLLNGIILGRPGGSSSHNVAISLDLGYFVAIVGAVGIGLGGFVRQTEGIRSRKPPGMP